MTLKTGIVMKTDNKKAYIMTNNGEFFKVKFSKNAPLLGQEYTGDLIVNKLNYKNNFKYLASAAAILFVVLLGGGVYAYNTPVSTVTLSIDPKVELKANIFKRVISVSTLDSEGAELIKDLKLKNTSLDNAVITIITKAKVDQNNKVNIDIKGNEIETSNIKKNLESKSINYSIENINADSSTKSSEIKPNENLKENKSTINKKGSQEEKRVLPKNSKGNN